MSVDDGVTFYTVEEVASLLRLSKMSVYRLIESKELRAHEFGRSLRISAEDFHDYVKKAVK